MKRVVVTADSHFPTKSDCGFAMIDVSNPFDPVVISRNRLPDHCGSFASSNGTLYCSIPGSFLIFDISDPFLPKLISRLKTNGGCQILISEKKSRVFIADWKNGVLVIDVSNFFEPKIIGRMGCNGDEKNTGEINPYGVSGLTIRDKLLFASIMDYDMLQNREALYVFDISKPGNPKWIARVNTFPCRGHGIVLKRNYVVIVGLRSTMVIDISRPEEPAVISLIETPDRFGMNPWLSGDFLYVPEIVYEPNRRLAGLRIFDISNPLHLKCVSELLIPARAATNVKVVGSLAYLACQCGIAIVDVSNPEKPVLLNLCSPCEVDRIAEGIEVIDYRDEVFNERERVS